jgi:hypothetical protein
MSIIPASRLSVSDLARLGNNFTPRSQRSPQQRRRREFVAAVNRSLATVGEQVSRLHSTPDYSTASAAVVA